MAQLVTCPECNKHLQVPENLLGKKVQCPECKHTFTASLDEPDEEKPSTATTSSAASASKKPAWEKKAGGNDSGTSIAKNKKKRRDDDDDDEEDDDDEDDDRRSRRRRRRESARRASYAPHRGGLILAFGIISLVGGHILCFPFIFGPIAWIMGNTDMAEIREGRMDPEGEGMTQVGRILGIISTILAIIWILLTCGYFAVVIIFFGAILGVAAQQNKNFPQPPPRF